jgi:O-antigen ligase
MSEPFYEEHGTYAAYLSIIFGISLSLSFAQIKSTELKTLAILTTIILFVAIILSFTRAAWLSIMIVLIVFIFFKSKFVLKSKALWVFVVILIVASIFFGSDLILNLQKNAATIVDIEKNVSNLERINRWLAAWNMFVDSPIIGLGYGTYPIHYYEYRDPLFATTESSMFAGPHNDYLQFLSETGLFGLISWLFIMSVVLFRAFKVFKTSKDPFISSLALGSAIGLLTYLLHSFFNGFLLYDKVAVPFWLTVGIIMTLEFKRNKIEQKHTA